MVEMKPPAVSRQLSALLLLFAAPLAGQTSLSIYSDGRVVVRRSLPQALEKGRNAVPFRLQLREDVAEVRRHGALAKKERPVDVELPVEA